MFLNKDLFRLSFLQQTELIVYFASIVGLSEYMSHPVCFCVCMVSRINLYVSLILHFDLFFIFL